MELEVGEYIRTKNNTIDRIADIRLCESGRTLISFEKSNSCRSDIGIEKYILKHSKNIIDLIEVGDYLNGQLIEKIYQKEKDKIFYEFLENKDGSYEVMEMCELKNIKSILTKEQFKEMEYRV